MFFRHWASTILAASCAVSVVGCGNSNESSPASGDQTVSAEQVVGIESADTVNGKALAITVADSAVTVGEAKVLKTDIDCEVGLIHAIDRVLIP